ncbi:MAG: DsbA family protein [Pseudomonadota bacterium]
MTRFLLTTALITLTAPAMAFDIDAMSETEREAFRAEVRAYLLDNPEVLIEAMTVLEDRQQGAQAADDAELVAVNMEALVGDDHSWVGGNPEGDITVIEFLDYRCGFCRRAFPEVEELIASDGNIRLIIKEFPILGEESTLSSRFAIATKLVEGDDAYKAVHDELMSFRGNVTPRALERVAADLGFDGDAIMGAMQLPEVDLIIAENRALADRLRISGTPTFVMGGQMLRGYLPLDGMRQVIAEERG